VKAAEGAARKANPKPKIQNLKPKTSSPQPPAPTPQPSHPSSLIPHPSSFIRLRRVQFKDADLKEALLLLAAQTGANVTILPDVTGKITVSLADVTLEDALNAILPPLGFSFRKQDGSAGASPSPYLIHRTPPIAPPPPLMVKVENGRLTLNATSVEVRAVLAAIGKEAGINIVPDAAVAGTLTLHLTNVAVESAIETVLAAQNLTLEKRGDIYLVHKPPPPQPPVVRQEPHPPALPMAVSDGLLTAEFKDADLRESLQRIASLAKLNLVLTPEVQGKVTLRLEAVPVLDALRLIAVAHDLTFEKVGSTYAMDKLPRGRTASGGAPMETRSASSFFRSRFSGLKVELEGAESLVTIEVEDADLHDLLKELALRTGTELVTFGQIQEKVTARVHQLPFEEALTTLLSGTKYAFAKQGKVYLVSDATPNSASARAVSSTEVIPLRYLNSADFAQVISSLLPNTHYKLLKEQNAVAVTGPSDLIARAKAEIAKLDQPGQQVMLEAVVIEMSTSASKTLGLTTLFATTRLRATAPGGELTFSSLAPFTREFRATLQALIAHGEARVLASPRIATLSGKQATIDISRVLYFRTAGLPTGGQNGLGFPVFTVQQVQAGVVLRITPTVGADGEISLDLQPEASSISGVSAEGLPEVSRRTVNTTLRVRDGETVVIGGLRQKEVSRNVNKVPVLSDLPLIGGLFRPRNRTERESELLMLVTPTLLKG
jgi:type IV pilus assembly protein PilQ